MVDEPDMPDAVIYVAKPGDDLAALAREYDSTVEAIWDDPRNAAHRAVRKLPEMLLPGDVIHIPRIAHGEMPVEPPELPPESVPGATPLYAGDDWPYELSPFVQSTPAPTWACPDGTCECHAAGPETQPIHHTVFLHDNRSRRMALARYRVLRHGRPIEGPKHADATGAISFDVRTQDKSVVIEWAPQHTPLDPELPYQRRYHLNMDPDSHAAVRQRLEHIGVCQGGTLEHRIEAFQRAYALAIGGRVASVAGPLAVFHDTATLPPLERGGRAPVPLAPDVRGPQQGSVSAVADRDAECHFSYRLLRSKDQPLGGMPYVLGIGGARVLRGITDDSGGFEYGDVPAGDYAMLVDGIVMHLPALSKDQRWRPLMVRPDR